jgi:hypothetical protein
MNLLGISTFLCAMINAYILTLKCQYIGIKQGTKKMWKHINICMLKTHYIDVERVKFQHFIFEIEKNTLPQRSHHDVFYGISYS